MAAVGECPGEACFVCGGPGRHMIFRGGACPVCSVGSGRCDPVVAPMRLLHRLCVCVCVSDECALGMHDSLRCTSAWHGAMRVLA